MSTFRIVPLSADNVNKIKQRMTDDFGKPVIEQLATGLGPCRVSLQPFNRGVDKRLLFKHSPFDIDNAYNQPGPIFIQREDVEPYSDIHRFPPEIKANKESFPLTLVGYSAEQMMVHSELVGDRDVDNLIDQLFETRPDIAYLHARNAQACCFICKIERM